MGFTAGLPTGESPCLRPRDPPRIKKNGDSFDSQEERLCPFAPQVPLEKGRALDDTDRKPEGKDALARARASLRVARRAALRGLQRSRERVTGALDSAAGRFKGSDTGERLNAAHQTRRMIKRADAAHSRGNSPMAFRLLEAEIRSKPDDEKLAIAFWRTCVSLNRAPDAADGLLRAVRGRIARGDLEQAASLWIELAGVVPEARVDAGSLIRMIPALREVDSEQAIRALHLALDPENTGLTTGLAGRVVDLARELDPPSALRAAQVALESPDLADSKRARLEALIAEFESPAEHEVHPPEQPSPAAPQTPSAPAPAQSDSPVENLAELVIEETVEAFAPQTRFASIEVTEAAPLDVTERSVGLQMSGGRRARIEHSKIQAVAVAEVGGLAEQPVVVIDLALNWHETDGGPLRVLRLRADRFKAPAFAGGDPQALRSFLFELLTRSKAVPLPDADNVLGDPFPSFDYLDTYQRCVLQVG